MKTLVDNMPAGHEIDQLVAERVMGWKYARHNGFDVPVYSYIVGPSEGGSLAPRRSCSDWKPSIDIAHAWEVVEKITDPSFSGRDALGIPASSRFSNWWNQENLWASTSEDAALAICRAALKSVL